jgi:hypothetical protein
LFSGQFATNFFGEVAFHPHTILGNIFQSAWRSYRWLYIYMKTFAPERMGKTG